MDFQTTDEYLLDLRFGSDVLGWDGGTYFTDQLRAVHFIHWHICIGWLNLYNRWSYTVLCQELSIRSRSGGWGWWIIFEPISPSQMLDFAFHHGTVLCNLASYYVFIPCPLTIIMRPAPTYTARQSAIIMRFRCDKIWNSAEGGRRTRDRAYWRGELSLHCFSQLPHL